MSDKTINNIIQEASANYTKSTPGPWIIDPGYTNGNVYRLWDSEGNFPEFMSVDTMDANAQLIAAAPDLLAALKAILDGQLQGNVDLTAQRFLDARAAIVKAEGR